eukprot:CAMPEP_0171783108 /NCGR_PEP_ID=MMETSP0991-20121206/61279_1 /TAXON_ID=483369 /ORGANISM="non described non described, Strain CCMP2098" /LENGTH=147 /DNA_ID=CAMNT_0012391147 /DNA_START=443 /DNA_END=890 /DNA_ORIENTATION=-
MQGSTVARGRWMVKEVIGVIQLKKYRTMKNRSTGRSGICPPQQVDRGPVFEDMRVANQMIAAEKNAREHSCQREVDVKEVIGVIQLKKYRTMKNRSTGRSGICPPQQVDRGPVFEDMRVANQMIAAEKNAREHNVLPINNNPSRTFF